MTAIVATQSLKTVDDLLPNHLVNLDYFSFYRSAGLPMVVLNVLLEFMFLLHVTSAFSH